MYNNTSFPYCMTSIFQHFLPLYFIRSDLTFSLYFYTISTFTFSQSLPTYLRALSASKLTEIKLPSLACRVTFSQEDSFLLMLYFLVLIDVVSVFEITVRSSECRSPSRCCPIHFHTSTSWCPALGTSSHLPCPTSPSLCNLRPAVAICSSGSFSTAHSFLLQPSYPTLRVWLFLPPKSARSNSDWLQVFSTQSPIAQQSLSTLHGTMDSPALLPSTPPAPTPSRTAPNWCMEASSRP